MTYIVLIAFAQVDAPEEISELITVFVTSFEVGEAVGDYIQKPVTWQHVTMSIRL